MPRARRVHVPGGHYHVILRGNHRQPVFDQPGDRDQWEGIVAEALLAHGATLHAYCWMTNHVHMVVQVQSAPLGRVVHRRASRFARCFQRRLATTGHLFERRHLAFLVQTDPYLLTLTRYIHWNPVRAGIVAAAEDYPWSSHRQYLGLREQPWLATDRILGTFSDERDCARQAYQDFMRTEPASRPAAIASKATESPADVSGSVIPLASAAARHELAALDDLAARIAAQHGLTVEILCSPSRARYFARVRAIIAWHAKVSGIATLSDVARRFGRSTAAISLAISGLRRGHPGVLTLGKVGDENLTT